MFTLILHPNYLKKIEMTRSFYDSCNISIGDNINFLYQYYNSSEVDLDKLTKTIDDSIKHKMDIEPFPILFLYDAEKAEKSFSAFNLVYFHITEAYDVDVASEQIKIYLIPFKLKNEFVDKYELSIDEREKFYHYDKAVICNSATQAFSMIEQQRLFTVYNTDFMRREIRADKLVYKDSKINKKFNNSEKVKLLNIKRIINANDKYNMCIIEESKYFTLSEQLLGNVNEHEPYLVVSFNISKYGSIEAEKSALLFMQLYHMFSIIESELSMYKQGMHEQYMYIYNQYLDYAGSHEYMKDYNQKHVLTSFLLHNYNMIMQSICSVIGIYVSLDNINNSQYSVLLRFMLHGLVDKILKTDREKAEKEALSKIFEGIESVKFTVENGLDVEYREILNDVLNTKDELHQKKTIVIAVMPFMYNRGTNAYLRYHLSTLFIENPDNYWKEASNDKSNTNEETSAVDMIKDINYRSITEGIGSFDVIVVPAFNIPLMEKLLSDTDINIPFVLTSVQPDFFNDFAFHNDFNQEQKERYIELQNKVLCMVEKYKDNKTIAHFPLNKIMPEINIEMIQDLVMISNK